MNETSAALIEQADKLNQKLEELTRRLSDLMSRQVDGQHVWEWRDLAREYAIYVADVAAIHAPPSEKIEHKEP